MKGKRVVKKRVKKSKKDVKIVALIFIVTLFLASSYLFAFADLHLFSGSFTGASVSILSEEGNNTSPAYPETENVSLNGTFLIINDTYSVINDTESINSPNNSFASEIRILPDDVTESEDSGEEMTDTGSGAVYVPNIPAADQTAAANYSIVTNESSKTNNTIQNNTSASKNILSASDSYSYNNIIDYSKETEMEITRLSPYQLLDSLSFKFLFGNPLLIELGRTEINGENQRKTFITAFVIDTSNVTFSSGEFTKRVEGEELYFCSRWNNGCATEWSYVQDLSGDEYTRNISQGRVAYGETLPQSLSLTSEASEESLSGSLGIQGATISPTQADGLIAYGEMNIAIPRYRTWNQTYNFSVEQNALSVGVAGTDDITWVVTKGNHQYDQIIMGTEDKSNDVNIQVYHSNTSWTDLLQVSADVPNSAFRAFDIAVEDISGDTLIVYEDTTTLNNNVKYRIWNGTAYTIEQTLTVGFTDTTTEANWISLTSKKGDDKIMLLVHNEVNDLYAILWNGTDFDSNLAIQASIATVSSSEQHFGFAWEEKSGQGLLWYGQGDLTFRTYDPIGGFGGTENTITTGNINSLRLCSDSSSDYIGIIWQDSGSDVNVRMWDGTQILASPPTEDAATEPHGTNNANVDCGWYNSSSALFGFVDSGGLAVEYFNFTKTNTWSVSDLTTTPSTVNFASSDIASLRFGNNHPTTSEIMIVAMDIVEDITLIRWNASNEFQGVGESPMEIDTEVLNGAQEEVMFDWFRYDPVPNVTNVTPSGVNFAVSAAINITANVTDNIAVSSVFANITLPNGTILQLPLLNRTLVQYNFTFSVTDLTGSYTVRIIANDTSVHQNYNSTETVTFTVGDVIIPNVTNVTPITGTNYDQNTIVNISANVTDETAVSIVRANVTFPNGSIEQITLINQSLRNYNGTFSTTGTIGTYTVRIIANDTSNNINSSETTTFTIGNAIPPNVTNITPVAGTSFVRNTLVNITANVTDNVNVSVVLANITFPNNSIFQIQLFNSSPVLFNSTFNVTRDTGTYTVRIIANDTSDHVNSSETTTFIITVSEDTVGPNITLNAPANNSNHSSSSIVFNFTAFDNIATTLNCSIAINNTINQTNTSVLNNTPTVFNISGFLDARYNWNITCNDSFANQNSSTVRVFTVDTHAPEFNSLTTTPSTEASLDPNANVTVLANVTDNTTSVDTVILQYKLSNNSDFTNLTLPFFSGSNLYNRSFNATQEGIYELRLWANDSVGNYAFSNFVNISVFLDKNWTRTPASFPAVRGTLNNNISVGNLTINNTGDFALHFNISSTSNKTYYNASSNFTLQAGEVRAIEVLDNATAAGVKTFTLNISANDTTAVPSSLTTTASIVVAPGQPVLQATFTTPGGDTLAVTQGDTNVPFTASLTNLGEGNASNVSFFFTIPSDWTVTFGSTALEFSQLNSGDSEENTIAVTIPSNATAGTYIVYVNATGINASGANLTTQNLTFGDSVTVTVSAAAEVLGVPGGGGAAAAPAAAAAVAAAVSGGGGVAKTKELEAIAFREEVVRIARGREQTIPVKVTNTYTNATLRDVTLQVEGFLTPYVKISPLNIPFIRSLQSRDFYLTLTIPSYLVESEYELTATITGNLVALDPVAASFTTKKITEVRKFILKIETVGQVELIEKIDEASEIISEMEEAGFFTEELRRRLKEAEELAAANQLTRAQQILDEIERSKKDAFAAAEIIKQVRESLRKANGRWLEVQQTEEALQLAVLAMERGDFSTALERAKNAQLIYVLETKGQINIFRFVLDWWWALLLGSMLAFLSGFFIYKKSMIMILEQRLRNIDKEEETLQQLILEAQQDYLVEKKISNFQYERMIKQYQERITKIRQIRLKLRNKRVAILKTQQELSNLSEERKELDDLMKKNQQEYLVEGKISRNMFLGRQEKYKERLAEIEQEGAVLQERLEKESGTKKYWFLTVAQKAITSIENIWRRVQKHKILSKKGEEKKSLKAKAGVRTKGEKVIVKSGKGTKLSGGAEPVE